MKVPKKLQPVLWSSDVSKLDHERDKYYVIHQILVYGRMEDLKWLFCNYQKSEIVNVFLQPYKSYPERTFYFVKNFLLDLKKEKLDKNNYVTSIFGPIRQRTARSV